MADDPYERLKAIAEQGRIARAIAAHEQLVVEPEPTPVVEPETDEVIAARVRWLLDHGSYAPALVAVESMQSRDDYFYGRCLYGVGRLVEARAAFDRVCVARPTFLEALLLRREVDRSLKRVRTTVGVQPPMELGVPEHLAGLRAVIDDPPAAIELLSDPSYADDPVAQLMLGNCLAFERRLEEAIAVFDRITSPDHVEAARLAITKCRGGETTVRFVVDGQTGRQDPRGRRR
jgi:tetratricopeptide (TPR) repeat protein